MATLKRATTLILPLVCGVAAVLPAAATTAVGWRPCSKQAKVLCGTVVTRLDPSGHRPGTVRLHVEVLRAASARTPRKAIFFVAGGPGQASAKEFDLVTSGETFQTLFPGYGLVAFDDRGTGRSGALACSGLSADDMSAAAVARCAAKLGDRRAFYSTEANVADTEAVRRTLGFDQIVLYGISYGTKQALAYASTHPSHTSRLILDSVEPPSDQDPFALRTIGAIQGSLGSLCRANTCRAVTDDFAGDLAKLANSLQAVPLKASITAATGTKQNVRVNGIKLLTLAVNTDLNAGVAAELPAAVSAALAGRPQALERLAALSSIGNDGAALGVNLGVAVATTCADGVFPWAHDTPVADRPALLSSAISALAPTATAPFGSWAALAGSAELCKIWPASPVHAPAKGGAFPDIPVLILAGSRDTRTPLTNARTVAKQFPQSRLLIVNGAGHSLSSSSVCALTHVFTWVAGVDRGSCPREHPVLVPLGPFEAPSSNTRPLNPTETLAGATATLQEAKAAFLATFGSEKKLNGFLGGTLTPIRSDDPLVSAFKLTGYRNVTGISLTGTIKYRPFASARWSGSVEVSGSRAAAGTLVAEGGRLAGSLGATQVSGRTDPA